MSLNKQHFAPGVRVVFAAVVLLPLLGLGWLANSDVREANDLVGRTVRIDELTARVADSLHAEALLAEESYWAQAGTSLGELGISSGLIRGISDLDVTANFLDAQNRVDAALAEGDFAAGLSDQLTRARQETEPSAEPSVGYESAARILSESIAADLAEIRSLARAIPDAGHLTDTVELLELSVDLRASISGMTQSYFSVNFPTDDDVRLETEQLFQYYVQYEADVRAVSESLQEEGEPRMLWAEIESDPDVVAFFGRVGNLTRSLFAPDPSTPVIDSEALSVPGGSSTDAFVGSLVAVSRHEQFVDAVTEDVRSQSGLVRSNAEQARNRRLLFVFGLGAVASLGVVGASLWIVVPLRRMAIVVAQLREGRQAGRVREAGPSEVRAAARALNEAVESMGVAEQMAMALARRDLDSPAFAVATSGRLGASLRDAVSALASSIADREEFRERLAYEATHDGLTGVANRANTMKHLGQALGRFDRGDQELAVMFIDIDGFKTVNDVHGHAVGDVVLRTVADRVSAAMRLGDHVGRLGGDEFVVIAEPIADLETAMGLANRVLQGLCQPFTTHGVSLSLSASIGVTLATVNSTPEDLLRDADLALYEAKGQGRSRVVFCDEVLKDRTESRITTEKALKRAIANDELEFHFQPILNAETGQLTSVEALLRWRLPDGTYCPPSEFIPLAERSELILAVDKWVLSEAAEQLLAWSTDPMLSALGVSVNVSALHLSEPTLAETVLRPLRELSIDPQRLTVEVTETAFLDDLDLAAATLRTLRDAGVRIAIDDFGTGYASLAHLRRLPVDILKIDHSFVDGLGRADDRTLVQLTIETGHLLGASIIAEGVETAEQARQLLEMGTDFLQGYGLGRPMPAREFVEWAKNRRSQRSGV
ncbi:MAG: sensor domain-containing phosphodiesterase [Acidimicrobiales bacterium]|nr:sensor domain-containing phosphodiesterase [Acidimicrobiales bacterium]